MFYEQESEIVMVYHTLKEGNYMIGATKEQRMNKNYLFKQSISILIKAKRCE